MNNFFFFFSTGSLPGALFESEKMRSLACWCVFVACVAFIYFSVSLCFGLHFSLCLFQKEKLQACMEQLGDVLFFHQNYSAEAPHSSQVSHRMAYLGTAMFTIRLLQTILPPEKVCIVPCQLFMFMFKLQLHSLISFSWDFCDRPT